MHTNNIELLRDEAQRLLRLNIEVLEQMMATKDVITEAKAGLQQTFDRTSTPKHIDVLRGELTKLNNMELVIAVVGTMKAGKSTTINAIVGTEVLPNRNRPMTALPTLIRHTPGQIEPVLKFENNEPINTLFQAIRKQMATGKVHEMLQSLSTDKDMQELIGNITSKQNFGKQYQGAANIFWCLKTLNDLVRLSSKLDVPFPFSSYANIDQMPVITVEFVHLRDAKSASGQLTLLDTPGPNEAGQDHLREMLTEQLKKSSAVLAVFDYTQLKSDADEHVRNEIKGIAEQHKGRLFALVNKFDEKDRHGDGKEAVQSLVAEELMKGLIEKNHVFPVSSKWGYLANRAKHEIAIHQELPDFEKASWVVDFAEAALGRRWKSQIGDAVAVLESANALWHDSGFHEPMEQVIRAAHTKAALFSIDSAADKILNSATNIENFFEIRKGALGKDTEKLIKFINELKLKVEKIKYLDDNIQCDIEKVSNDLDESIKKSLSKCQEDINIQIKIFINTSKNGSWTGVRNHESIAIAEEDNAILYMLEKMTDIIKDKMASKIVKVEAELYSMIDNFRSNFDMSTEAARKTLIEINEYFSDEGLFLKNKGIVLGELSLPFKVIASPKEGVRHDKEKKTYQVEKDGWWNSIARKLSSSWGYEEKSCEVDNYTINFDEIESYFLTEMARNFSDYKAVVNNIVLKPLKQVSSDYFFDVKLVINNVRSDFEQAILDKNKDHESIILLMENLDLLSKDSSRLYQDSELLKIDVDEMKAQEVKA